MLGRLLANRNQHKQAGRVRLDYNSHLVLDDGLLLLAPKAEVQLRARRQFGGAWRIGQAKDGLVVCVLEDPLGLTGPDDDGVVDTSRGEVLPILCVVDS